MVCNSSPVRGSGHIKGTGFTSLLKKSSYELAAETEMADSGEGRDACRGGEVVLTATAMDALKGVAVDTLVMASVDMVLPDDSIVFQ